MLSTLNTKYLNTRQVQGSQRDGVTMRSGFQLYFYVYFYG